MLQQVFVNNLLEFTDNQTLVNELWVEIEQYYNGKDRFYHNLRHIEHLYFLLKENKNEIQDWATLLNSIFYHDIIYNVKNNDNEEQSAIKMRVAMKSIHFPIEKIELSFKQILATQKHELTGDNDTDLFTDADIAILGSDWELYQGYASNIRKEYAFYPDFLYNIGRKKVLKHFLEMKNIYKTPLFAAQFESKAKENLEKELQILQ